MRDLYIFLAVMAFVAAALAALDRQRRLSNGKQVAALEVAHIACGAGAGIIAVLYPKVQAV